MLPLLRDQVLIALSFSHISLVRLRGLAGYYSIVKTHKSTVQLNKEWTPIIEELSRCLRQSDWQNANVKIVISNAMTCFTLLPWSDVTLTDDEEMNLARVRFDTILGVSSQQLEFSLTESRFGQPRLACAVNKDMLSSLRQLAKENKLNIVSIQPHFITAVNYWQKQLQDTQFHFLMADDEKLLIAFFRNGQLQKLSSEQLSEPLSTDILASSYQRELLINDLSGESIQQYIFSKNKLNIPNNDVLLSHFKSLQLPDNYLQRSDAFLAAAG